MAEGSSEEGRSGTTRPRLPRSYERAKITWEPRGQPRVAGTYTGNLLGTDFTLWVESHAGTGGRVSTWSAAAEVGDCDRPERVYLREFGLGGGARIAISKGIFLARYAVWLYHCQRLS